MKRIPMSRRRFLGTTVAVSALGQQRTYASGAPTPDASASQLDVIAAFGDLLIPSRPGDPGYADLEIFGISEEVRSGLPGLTAQELEVFDTIGADRFGGKRFASLHAEDRADYARQLLAGEFGEPVAQATAKKAYVALRLRILSVYYMNFPERLSGEGPGAAGSKPDAHQVINPNSTGLVTGWDVAGFRGPWSWEEEEARRAYIKTIAWKDVRPL